MNVPISDWRDRRVWLFGASTGIGAALARALLGEGARVALSARSAGRLAAVAGDSPRALLLPCDAADAEAIERAAAQLVARWGGIDVAIYLAGDYVPMRAWEIDRPAARRMIEINLGGAVAFAASVVPRLLQAADAGRGEAAAGTAQRGEIAFVASVAGYRGLPKSLVYGPTKAALINFTEALAFDLLPRGVGVRLINPGFVATPLTARNDFAMPALQTPEQAAAAILAGYRGSAFEIHF
ncbi:MAG TPA: SDR family NAD(P)-dependent oxidoreductase, partial [Azospira sp.]|nr:SDR family NAD(P)-dependent oxidoreductase [Azospira sp.]